MSGVNVARVAPAELIGDGGVCWMQSGREFTKSAPFKTVRSLRLRRRHFQLSKRQLFRRDEIACRNRRMARIVVVQLARRSTVAEVRSSPSVDPFRVERGRSGRKS